jgi:3-phenylpropionate/cinnamic acid dioxygenase small subunit
MVNAMGIVAIGETYDRLAALVRDWRSVPIEHRDGRAAEQLVVHEARTLDDRCFDEWIAGWADDGCLWVPLNGDAHPAHDQSYFLDDLRRLRERVGRWQEPTAWSVHPAPDTIRHVGNVESIIDSEQQLRVRSIVTLYEQGRNEMRIWPMRQYHLFTAPDADGVRRRRAKVLVVPALRHAVPHTSVLL